MCEYNSYSHLPNDLDSQIYKDEQDREEAFFEYLTEHWDKYKAFCSRNPLVEDKRRAFIASTEYEWAEWIEVHDFPEWLVEHY